MAHPRARPVCLPHKLPLLAALPTKAWGGTIPEATAVPFILLSFQVVLETLTGQRAVRMCGAKTKYLVSFLRQGRKGARQEA